MDQQTVPATISDTPDRRGKLDDSAPGGAGHRAAAEHQQRRQGTQERGQDVGPPHQPCGTDPRFGQQSEQRRAQVQLGGAAQEQHHREGGGARAHDLHRVRACAAMVQYTRPRAEVSPLLSIRE